MSILFLELFSYFCGSIPFGLIISKLVKNVDIREHGSHNIGSTNVARTLGKKWGAVVLLLDGFKAVIPLIVTKYVFAESQEMLVLMTFFVVIGHIFPVWLDFKGGKGIACILFSYFVLDYRLGFLFLLVWLIIFFVFKISALSALTAMLLVAVASYFISLPYFVLSTVLTPIIFYKHKENIKRILSGEELKFKKKIGKFIIWYLLLYLL